MESDRTYTLDILKQYVGDDPVQIKEMLQLFLDTVPNDVEQMKKYLKNDNWEDLYKLSHRTKPTFKVFAMNDLYVCIKRIEDAAKDNDSDNNINLYFEKFDKLFQTFKSLIEYELSVIK